MSMFTKLWIRIRRLSLPITLLILLLLFILVLIIYIYFQKNVDDAASQINKAIETVSVEKPGECLILSTRNCTRGHYIVNAYGFSGQMAAFHIGDGTPFFAPFDGTIDSILIADKKTSLQGIGLKKTNSTDPSKSEVIFFFYHARSVKDAPTLKEDSIVKKGSILGYVTGTPIPNNIDKQANLHVGYTTIEGIIPNPQKVTDATPTLKDLLRLKE